MLNVGPDLTHLGLRDFVAILQRRQVFILSTVIALTGLSTAAALILPPVYTAAAAIVLDHKETRMVETKSALEEEPQDVITVDTQIHLIESRSFARSVIEQLALLEDREFNVALRSRGATASAEEPDDWARNAVVSKAEAKGAGQQPVANNNGPASPSQEAVRSVLKLLGDAWRTGVVERLFAPTGAATLPDMQLLPATPTVSGPEQVEHTVDLLLGRIEVERAGHGLVLIIEASSTNPKKAARIANAFAEHYVDLTLETKRSSAATTTQWLSARVDQLRQDVAEAEKAVTEYRREHRLVDDRREDPVIMQMSQLNTQLTVAQVERAAAEARLDEVTGLLAQGPEAAATMVTSPLLVNLRNDEADLLRQEAELATIYGDRHPQMMNIRAQAASVRKKIDDEVKRIVQDLTTEVAVARARETQLFAAVNDLGSQISVQNDAAIGLHELERQLEATRTLYNTFVGRLKTLSEQQDALKPSAQIVSTANVPTEPSFPQPKLMVAGGFVGSLTLSLMLAFLVESLDSRLRSVRRLQRLLEVPTLALMPKIERSARRRGLTPYTYMLQKPGSAFAEAARAVQTACLLSDVDRPPQLVLVTSSLPDEGKTTLALCLGAAAASNGRKAVVVDLDLHRSRLREAASQPRRALGLAEYLSGDCALDEIIHNDTRCQGLNTIAVSRRPPRPSSLLTSHRLQDLLQELRRRYSLVVLDTPPLLAVNDTRILARFADAVLFVVRWGKTKEDAAETAMEQLVTSNAAVIGSVFTQVDVRKHARGVYGGSLQHYSQYESYYAN
jgi:polysaccharide biosynthesis transport protein